ncbi:hypothetical protein AURDEDRAFT_165796 [Auricularia subglabra TFB-10046 SS5]|nr:hypothetical protein AURDEDRAFT_165796 [Auricularia subglabra TFB-10046 SS5]
MVRASAGLLPKHAYRSIARAGDGVRTPAARGRQTSHSGLRGIAVLDPPACFLYQRLHDVRRARSSRACARTDPRLDVPFRQLRPTFRSLQRFHRGAHELFRKSAWGCSSPPSMIRTSHALRLSAGTQSACFHTCAVQVASDVTTSCIQTLQQCAVLCLREDEPDVAAINVSFAENCPALADHCGASCFTA